LLLLRQQRSHFQECWMRTLLLLLLHLQSLRDRMCPLLLLLHRQRLRCLACPSILLLLRLQLQQKSV
jgi:hypothetical protein